ncbi:hypothetical protein YB2330_002122 [Saitoella coloradoensis]
MANISTNRNAFFQSDASQASAARRALKAKHSSKHGSPVELKSKILALCIDELASEGLEKPIVFTGESTGIARRIDLNTGNKEFVFRGHTGPVASVALHTTSSGQRLLFTGSWDKSVRVWDIETCKCLSTVFAHSDFVKSLLVVPHLNLLLSGSADASIAVWKVQLNGQLLKVHTLKGHTRAVEDLTLDPSAATTTAGGVVVYSASSDASIREWRVGPEEAVELPNAISKVHETSIYKLRFDYEGALWSASADKTARRTDLATKVSDTALEHPDFVKDILVTSNGAWAVTACRDEQVRIFDIGSGAIVKVIEGHYDEVSALAMWSNILLSASLDGTIRQWSMVEADVRAMKKVVWEEEEEEEEKPATLTAEEEAELADLMGSDDNL